MGSKKKKMIMVSSLSRRETIPVPENASCGGGDKRIGCISGIFHFLSRRHLNNSRKRPSSAGRKNKTTSLPKEPQPPPPPEQNPTTLPKKDEDPIQLSHITTPQQQPFCVKVVDSQRQHLPCEVQRSPTLPSEIRRSSSVGHLSQLDSPRRPTPLVVKLMGLDEVPVSSPDSAAAAAAAEKRRKLLGALEKCDEDLKTLKRIIDAAVRVADKRRKTGINVGELEDGELSVETVKSLDSTNNGEQPSPVSVLQSISSPTYQSKSLKKINDEQKGSQITAIQLRAPEPSRVCISGDHRKKNQETCKQSDPSIFHQITIERLPLAPRRKENKLPEEHDCAKGPTEGGRQQGQQWECKRSRVLVENVSEEWEDRAREQSRELERVGGGLERGIFRDLVDEFVRELLGCNSKGLFISQGTCRKRLCF